MRYLQAAVAILTYADRALTVGELTAIALAQHLIEPRGRTPDRSMSSVLYRRMIADPNAPIACERGRFRLHSRAALPAEHRALQPAIRQVQRGEHRSRQALGTPSTHRAAVLPPPPFLLPDEVVARLQPPTPITRHDRAVGQLAEGLSGLQARRSRHEGTWDLATTDKHLIAPLLRLLGYRRGEQQQVDAVAGRTARMLHVSGSPQLYVEAVAAERPLADGQARPALPRARGHGARWLLLSNGLELRLYDVTLALLHGTPAAGLVLRLSLLTWGNSAEREEVARHLWLVTHGAVSHGSLDAYLAARAVGTALLAALDDPNSALLCSLDAAVTSTTSLRLAPSTLARQARLAIRQPRGRDGQPLAPQLGAVVAAGGDTLPPVARPRESTLAPAG